MLVQTPSPSSRFVSLRWRILLGFTGIFSLVFGATFYWFHEFSTERALIPLRFNLDLAQRRALKHAEALLPLQPSDTTATTLAQLSADPRWQDYLARLVQLRQEDPRVRFWLGLPDGETGKQLRLDAEDGTVESLPFTVATQTFWLQTLRRGENTLSPLYTTPSGKSWIALYTPLSDASGQTVAALAVELDADFVRQVQRELSVQLSVAGLLTYAALFGLAFAAARILTRPVMQLTAAAERISEGDYSPDLAPLSRGHYRDEISTLARVFEQMVAQVRGREETLKQQVVDLKIEIDQVKRQSQVKEIVETDFFQDLQAKAKVIRRRQPDTDR